MKYGIHYGYWAENWEDDSIPLFHRAKQIGLDVLEISGRIICEMNNDELYRIKQASRQENICIVSGMGLPADKNIASLDPNIRARGIEYVKNAIVSAEKAGIHTIAGILYASWFYDASKPVYKEETTLYSIENMGLLAEFAAEHGVVLMMEVCNRFATYMLNCAQEAAAYVKAVGKDNVKIMLDTFHMNVEEDSFSDAIHIAGQQLGYIHLCEGNRKLPGTGRLPWKEIIRALKEIRFEGPAVMECFITDEGSVGHDLKIWRKLSCDLEEVQKDLNLKRALQYLKKIEDNECQ